MKYISPHSYVSLVTEGKLSVDITLLDGPTVLKADKVTIVTGNRAVALLSQKFNVMTELPITAVDCIR